MFSQEYQDRSRKIIEYIFSIFNHKYFMGKSVADFGAGHGEIGAAFFRIGAAVSAIDARKEHLKLISKKYPSIKTINADLDKNLILNNNFNVTLCLGLLCHLKNYEKTLRYICSTTQDLILETAVLDSDDPNAYLEIKEHSGIFDASFNGFGNRVSQSRIENILAESGMYFIRVDSSNLNHNNFIYDWNITNSNKNDLSLRRFWIASKNPNIINEVNRKVKSTVYEARPVQNKIIKPIKNNINLHAKNNEIVQENNIENISIIIPAKKAQEFIDECVNSIFNQKFKNIEYEILIGIDNCDSTLRYVKSKNEIYNKSNIKIFYFNENLGPYIIKNTLIDHAKYNKILFFDADDIMHEDMLSVTVNELNQSSTVRFKFFNFNHGNNPRLKSKPENFHAAGIMGVKKDVFINYNGFEGWVCAADAEFIERMRFFKEKESLVNSRLFYRRIHSHNLEFSKQTDFRSEIRKNYHVQIKEKQKNKNFTLDKRKINNNFINISYEKVSNNTVEKISIKDNKIENNNIEKIIIKNSNLPITNDKNSLSIIIPAWKASKFIDECINSILIQKNNDINIEILIGIDACQETLNYINNNYNLYNKDYIKIYYFNENIGPYIIRNTLSNYASYDNLLFFDADDVMTNNMIKKILSVLNNNAVRFNYFNFSGNLNEDRPTNGFAGGAFAIKKDIFNSLNGFEPWICAADGEFIKRCAYKQIETYHIKEPLFYRRLHQDNQTSSKETGMKSNLRKTYHQIIQEKMSNNFKNELKSKSINNKLKLIKLNKNVKYLHLVISRVAIKWKKNNIYRNEEVGLNWDEWVKDSFNLFNDFCRKSLKNQTNQNFKLISLIDKDIKNVGEKLDNEILLKVNGIEDIFIEIKKYINSIKEKYDYILVTRIDRDDVIKNNFIDNLQNHVNNYINNNNNKSHYFDIKDNYMFDLKNNKIYKKNYYNNITSPFISVLEPTNNFECIVYKYDHDLIKRKINGTKHENLEVIQVIHDNNILNGKNINYKNLPLVNINLFEYGVVK